MLGVLCTAQANAEELSIPIPKIKVETTNNGTGVKISVTKNNDVEGYEVIITGKAAVNKKYKSKVYIQGKLVDADNINVKEYIFETVKSTRNVEINYLPAGSYKVKVRALVEKSLTRFYGDYCKEKSFKLQENKKKNKNTKYDFSKVKKGDIVEFGIYEQDLDYTNGKETIDWIVVEKTKKSILLVSKYAIDQLPFNIKDKNVTWENSSIRKWLNKEFINNAFNKTEKSMIKEVTLKNLGSARGWIDDEKDTKDKIFLLTEYDLLRGFELDIILNSGLKKESLYKQYDIGLKCALACYKGIKAIGSSLTSDGEKTCYWWLRTSYSSSRQCYVDWLGDFRYGGESTDEVLGVRPAMYISLKS